jgi:hypothetical protein
MASSEGSDSWFFYSKSKDLVPANIDRMKGFHVLFKWKDQGWGKQKSRVAVKVMNGTDEVFQIEDWGVAPHINETVSVMYDKDHYFVKNLVAGCRFELWYVVGGGGGHRLRVEDFSVDILSVEGNKFDDISRSPKFIFLIDVIRCTKREEAKE